MASIVVSDDNPNQQQQSLIPVLTVFKNNSILKNIILLNNNNNNDDQILLVGRHPNCNIVLFHPSISRFHLQIRFNPSSRSISLLDLSSVHGTWVCGRKLDHGVSVDLKEGDSFQLGSSSRVYLLQFVSQFDDVDALKVVMMKERTSLMMKHLKMKMILLELRHHVVTVKINSVDVTSVCYHHLTCNQLTKLILKP